jgi:hypothetical protein
MKGVITAMGVLAALPFATALGPIPIETAQKYFIEAQSLCQADHAQLWGISLCGPIMFVDANSRSIVANQADAKGLLSAKRGVFMGSLPEDQIVANTAVEWSGVHWTQIVWPLPDEKWKRETLIAHELFHRVQNQLNLPSTIGGENAHLDTLDGRYYLQLEWRALARALEARGDAERRRAASDALLFRSERYRRFPDAAAQEQALELNEGLAEYTGVRVGNATPDEQVRAALSDLSSHAGDSTFVRSFAYATGPAYGLLLDRYASGWRRELKAGTGYDTLLRTALHFALPAEVEQAAERQAASYGGAVLRMAEKERDTKRQQAIAGYKAKFIDGPILTLQFQNMHVQFDPRNLQPLENSGTVYPNIRISDDWGILDAESGALVKADWSAVIVVAPTETSGSTITGEGWTLSLKPGWKITSGTRDGDYVLGPRL